MNPTMDITKNNELENPVNLMTGAFDIAFVVIFLLPIFILAISYDLLSSERERGTLAMILAHPISLKELMALEDRCARRRSARRRSGVGHCGAACSGRRPGFGRHLGSFRLVDGGDVAVCAFLVRHVGFW